MLAARSGDDQFPRGRGARVVPSLALGLSDDLAVLVSAFFPLDGRKHSGPRAPLSLCWGRGWE